MIRKMTFGLIAAAAIGAFAFTTPKASSVNYSIDTKASTATWLAKKVTGQHEGGVAISKGNIVSDGKNITGGTFETIEPIIQHAAHYVWRANLFA